MFEFSIKGLLSNISVRSIIRFVVGRIISPAFKYTADALAIWYITHLVCDRPITNVKLVNSIQRIQGFIDGSRNEIVQYAQDNNLRKIRNVDDVPNITELDIRESALPNILAEKYYVAPMLTSPVTQVIRVFTNWLETDIVNEDMVTTTLIHEYGHVVYGNENIFKLSSEDEADHFTEWFLDAVGLQ